MATPEGFAALVLNLPSEVGVDPETERFFRRVEEMAALSDELLARRAVELRFRCGSGEPLDSLLVDAFAPVFLRALEGRGVHVLTYNDYLARRDAAWMGPVFDRLGLSVGCVQEGMEPSTRRWSTRPTPS